MICLSNHLLCMVLFGLNVNCCLGGQTNMRMVACICFGVPIHILIDMVLVIHVYIVIPEASRPAGVAGDVTYVWVGLSMCYNHMGVDL